MTMLPLVFALVTGFSSVDVCELLTADDIRTVQHVAVKERKPSADSAGGLRFAQCFYTADDFVRSISVTVINDEPSATNANAVHAFWQNTFNPQRHVGRKNGARAVADLGDAAFWTSDSRAGVLYVRAGDVVIRLSVGGVSDEADRLERTTALAGVIVKRLAR